MAREGKDSAVLLASPCFAASASANFCEGLGSSALGFKPYSDGNDNADTSPLPEDRLATRGDSAVVTCFFLLGSTGMYDV